MTEDRLIPLGELREVLADLMRGRAYMAEEPYITREGDSWVHPRPLPPDKGLRLSNFLDAISPLPDPARESEIAAALIPVFQQRGFDFLAAEFAALCDQKWPDPDKAEPDSGKQDTDGWMPRCAWCGERCNDQRARYCRPSHRQQAYKKRKRANGRVTAG
jgi:hypothetical protein